MKNLGVIITARGGSKRLPGKNTKILNGKPLIDYSIETALSLSNIKAIAVSSDSDEILKRGSHFGVNTISRPKVLAQDNSLVVEAIIHASKQPAQYRPVSDCLPAAPSFFVWRHFAQEKVSIFRENWNLAIVAGQAAFYHHPLSSLHHIDLEHFTSLL